MTFLCYFIICLVILRYFFKVSPNNDSSDKGEIINLYDDFFERMNDTFMVRQIVQNSNEYIIKRSKIDSLYYHFVCSGILQYRIP